MFDEQEFLDVARHLQFADPREGFRRSAISRAYYSVFLLARTISRSHGWVPQSGSGADHRAIADTLKEFDYTLASELRELRLLRNDADYAVQSQLAGRMEENAQKAIDLATFIRRELERLT